MSSSSDQNIHLLRQDYEQAVAAGNQAEANHLYAKIASYSPAVQPICPRCRKTSTCRCSQPATLPANEGW